MRPSDWAPVGFDHDPVPGDPTVVSSAASDYATIAATLEDAATNLRGIAGADECVSEAVAAIMEQAEEVAARLDKAQTRYEGVAAALSIYAVPLSEAQTWSVDALDAAIVARSATNASVEDAEFYEARLREPDLSPELESYYEERRAEVYAELQSHDGALENAIARLQSAIEHRDSAAATASSSIHDVEESSGLNDSFWDNTVQFIEENKDTIDFVVEIIGIIAAVALVVSLLIPGLNAIVASVLLVATLIQLANAAVQGLAGTMSPAEAIISIALAALTFTGLGVVGARVLKLQSSKVALAFKMSNVSKGVRGLLDSAPLQHVEVARRAALSGINPVAQKIADLGLYRVQAQQEAIANVLMLSGNTATAARYGIQAYAAAAQIRNYADASVSLFGVAGLLATDAPTSNWRLGGDW
ncbi:hypothetical protein I6E52_03995 [Salinibacterium sp. NG253]|uniref:hypothetical protein n=1 Tax=Salinibacterium sp. NG253 TaxID=2792039 RepID=UPI0018CF6420|nr:hypothetical protein [Salinibacterium sp. NG253]MBH0116002.1 hypothetical protein [Salinibacterium sp. NG253]